MQSAITTTAIAVLAGILLAGPASAGKPKVAIKNPDLTYGETIPEGADHDWTLGATGARGWKLRLTAGIRSRAH